MIKNIHIKELISGAVVSLGTRVFAFSLGYLFFMLLGQYYGAEGVGVYAFSFTLLSILSMIASMGTTTYLLREVGKNNGSDLEVIFAYFKQVVMISIPIAIVLGLTLMLSSQLFALYIFDDEALVYSFIAVGVALPFYTYLQLSSALFRGLKKVFLSEFFQMFGMHLVNFLLLMFLILFVVNRELEDVTTLFVLTFVILFSMAVVAVLQRLYKIKDKKTSEVKNKRLITESIPMMVSALSMLLLGSIDNIMLGLYVPISAVGAYAITVKIATVSSIVLAAVNTMMAPKIAELFHINALDELQKLIAFASKMLMLFSVIILGVIVLFPIEILSFFGPEFTTDNIATVLLVVTLAQFFNTISGSVGIMMNMTNNQVTFQKILLVALAIKILFNLILIPLYGLLGAAIASLVSTVLWNFYLVYFIKKRHDILTMYIPKLFLKRVN